MNLKNAIVGAVLGMALVPALFQEAKSDALPAYAGKALFSSEAGCFSPTGWGAGVRNDDCNGFRPWYIAVQNRFGAGIRTFRAVGDTVFQFDTPARCSAYVVSATSALIWQTPSGPLNTSGDVSLGSFNSTSANNTFNFTCEVPGPDFSPNLGVLSVRVT